MPVFPNAQRKKPASSTMMERPLPRRGVRRRHTSDDDDITREMPPNKKALVDLLENLCISMNSTNSTTSSEKPNASTFISSNGPRQYLYPRRNRYSLYSEYMRQMKDTPSPPPRDPSLGTMVLYNSPSALPSPLRRYMLPPFTIPEGQERDDDDDDAMDVDMDVDDEGGVVQTQPRLAGNLTHGEWFLDDDEDDAMDIMDML